MIMMRELELRRLGTARAEAALRQAQGEAIKRGVRSGVRALWTLLVCAVCGMGLMLVWGAVGRVLWEMAKIGWTYAGWWK